MWTDGPRLSVKVPVVCDNGDAVSSASEAAGEPRKRLTRPDHPLLKAK